MGGDERHRGDLTPRPVAASVDELVAGATDRRPFANPDGKSGSRLERVVIGGEPFVLKVMHVDDDWIARSLGDLGCLQVSAPPGGSGGTGGVPRC
jgi:hypothetical protein